MPMIITDTFANLKKKYEEENKGGRLKALVYSEGKVGKTTLLGTARAPVLIVCTDPDGLVVLRKEIANGRVIPYQINDIADPAGWDKMYDQVMEWDRQNIFEQLGTFAFDSITTLQRLAMNKILKNAGRYEMSPKGKGWSGVPQQDDWMPQMQLIENLMVDLLRIPCDAIVTAHVDEMKNEVTGVVKAGPLVTGKLKPKLCNLFSEIWYMQAQLMGNKITRTLCMQATNSYTAGSRLASEGNLDITEPPDIKGILKKAGWAYDDLPLPNATKDVQSTVTVVK